MSKGCNTQGQGPRSKPSTYLVPNGFRLIQRGEVVIREQIMTEHTTHWMTENADDTPLLCGYIRKDGDHQAHLCAGCENEVKS